MTQQIYNTSFSLFDLAATYKTEKMVAHICNEMAITGFKLDLKEATSQLNQLEERLVWIDFVISSFIPKKVVKGKTVLKIFNKDGSRCSLVSRWCVENKIEITAPFSKVLFEKINLGSPKQVSEYLLSKGWKPDEWNYKVDKDKRKIRGDNGRYIKSSPKLTKSSFKSLKGFGIAGEIIKYYRKVVDRSGTIKRFIKNANKEGRVPSKMNPLGTETRRMTHSIIVNVPAVKKKVFFKYIRRVFTVDEGRILIGFDASQIQVRGLCHYANNSDFLKLILLSDEGKIKDIHSTNAERAGVDRASAKSIFYGYLFGAGINKTAEQLGVTKKEAEILVKKFNKAVPFVEPLIADLIMYYNTYGYILGITSCKIYVSSIHKILVYLLQDFEQAIMKLAMKLSYTDFKNKGIDAKFVTMQHDEFQVDCIYDKKDEVKKILENNLEKAGTLLGSKCPIKGEAKEGSTWADTH